MDTTSTDEYVNLAKIAREPGVSDLQPMMARSRFAQALKAERLGDDKKAAQFLEDAIKATLEAK